MNFSDSRISLRQPPSNIFFHYMFCVWDVALHVALTQIKILVSSLTIVFCFTSIALFVQNVLVVFISECKAGLSRSLILVSRSTITIVSDEKNDLILQKIYVDDMVNLNIIHCKERTNNLTENI